MCHILIIESKVLRKALIYRKGKKNVCIGAAFASHNSFFNTTYQVKAFYCLHKHFLVSSQVQDDTQTHYWVG